MRHSLAGQGTNGMVERVNGRIEGVLQSHHFRSGEELETTLLRYAWLYNQQLPQAALGSKTRLQAMKVWHKPNRNCSRNSRTTVRDGTIRIRKSQHMQMMAVHLGNVC